MGEYIGYKGTEIKLGTGETLYYATYPKFEQALKNGWLSKVDANESPAAYSMPGSGFLFRFPFPDEDKLPLGEIGGFPYSRGVPVKLDPAKEGDFKEFMNAICGKDSLSEITRQKLIRRQSDGKLCLALVVRNPDTGLSFRIVDDAFIQKISADIRRNHITNETDLEKKNFYQKIVSCIREGYRLKPLIKVDPRQLVRNKTKPKHKRGLR